MRLATSPPDTRPRAEYRLPDGSLARVIFDHGEQPPLWISFTLKGGQVVMVPRAVS